MTGRRAAAITALVAATIGAAWVGFRTGGARAIPEDLPPQFAGKRNPLAGAEVVTAGARLFLDNCASCHGARGDGHGPAAPGLEPPPADFRGGAVLAQRSDAYLFYRLSTGKPGTAMPSFHGVLAENERWQVIAYLRSLPAPPRS